MLYEYSGVVVSDLPAIRLCLEGIINEISKLIDDEEIIFDIRLILNELVLNGAIHGNQLSSEKEIKLDIDLRNGKMEIVVEDEGEGILRGFEEYDPTELKCCGRGLVIVDKLSDELFIDRNKIMVIKNLI